VKRQSEETAAPFKQLQQQVAAGNLAPAQKGGATK
jgi:hypothetical protein